MVREIGYAGCFRPARIGSEVQVTKWVSLGEVGMSDDVLAWLVGEAWGPGGDGLVILTAALGLGGLEVCFQAQGGMFSCSPCVWGEEEGN